MPIQVFSKIGSLDTVYKFFHASVIGCVKVFQLLQIKVFPFFIITHNVYIR